MLEPDLLAQLAPQLAAMRPLAAPFYPTWVAANQDARADNTLPGCDKAAHLATLRRDIARFKAEHCLESVVVVWTATTERFACEEGLGDADALLRAIARSDASVSPSVLFAVASILEGCAFLNGSPQNTLLPGVVGLAEREGVAVGGSDFKSGQTKLKSILVDSLLGAGIKPLSIVSYNHLGNRDGQNLSSEPQFLSKEASKAGVLDDAIAANEGLLFAAGERPDHVVVIKYVPQVGDSKRALDEYHSEIFLGGRHTMTISSVCEDR